MPLTPEEQEELNHLEKELGQERRPNLDQVREDLLGPKARADRMELNKGAVDAAASSFMPEGTANPLSWLASKTGLNKIPGKLMSSAVGLKKYIPGVGESLMDQGVIGTKGMMAEQVGTKLGEQEAAKQALLKDLPGTVDSQEVADSVKQLSDRYQTPGGIIPRVVKPEFQKVRGAVVDIANRGPVSAPEAGKLASIAGNLGYRGDKPVQKLEGIIGQREHAGYREGIEKLYSQANPGQPNEVANTYQKLSSLIKAKRGLAAPETSAVSIPSRLGLGSLIGGLPGATAAYGSRVAGKVAARAPMDEAALQAAESNKASSGLTPDEKAEKDQLEKELGLASP